MMWQSRKWRTRRHVHGRGFALAEALVALSVAAMTMVLLTGATWGLSHATRTPPPKAQAPAFDTLIARRLVHAWIGAINVRDGQRLDAALWGQANEIRVHVSSEDLGRFVGTLRIERDADGRSRLWAFRDEGMGDVRRVAGNGRRSLVLESTAPLRFSYMLARTRSGDTWSYLWEDDMPLPLAIALEIGSERIVIAPLPASRSPDCVVKLGLTEGAEGSECRLR